MSSAPAEQPLCLGKSDLFESADEQDHLEAKALCDVCPARDWCEEQFKAAVSATMLAGYGPSGTWAGRYMGRASTRVNLKHKIAECGTPSGYKAHLRKGETTCQKCRDSVNRAKKKKQPD